MKNLFLFLVMVLSSIAAGSSPPWSVYLNTATQISTSYAAPAAIPAVAASHLVLLNAGTAGICCNISPTDTVPSASNGHEICLGTNTNAALDQLPLFKYVYCRNQASNTGTLGVIAW